MVKKIGLSLLFAGSGAMASPFPSNHHCKTEHLWGLIPYEVCKFKKSDPPVAAPEIDPASASAGLTLMVGGLAVLRSRREKNSKA
jgi:hypothetical protein